MWLDLEELQQKAQKNWALDISSSPQFWNSVSSQKKGSAGFEPGISPRHSKHKPTTKS